VIGASSDPGDAHPDRRAIAFERAGVNSTPTFGRKRP
jgi:hypothetical protein